MARIPKERKNPLVEITLDLHLVIKISEKGLNINGLIQGLKEGASQIRGAS